MVVWLIRTLRIFFLLKLVFSSLKKSLVSTRPFFMILFFDDLILFYISKNRSFFRRFENWREIVLFFDGLEIGEKSDFFSTVWRSEKNQTFLRFQIWHFWLYCFQWNSWFFSGAAFGGRFCYGHQPELKKTFIFLLAAGEYFLDLKKVSFFMILFWGEKNRRFWNNNRSKKRRFWNLLKKGLPPHDSIFYKGICHFYVCWGH